jgi:hypothetical protein
MPSPTRDHRITDLTQRPCPGRKRRNFSAGTWWGESLAHWGWLIKGEGEI